MSAPPPQLTMKNGEVLSVTGHQPTITAVRSGPWGNPHTWDQKRAPQSTDNVWIPSGNKVTVYCHRACRNLVHQGVVEFLDDFQFRYSTITGLPGGKLICGTKSAPVSGRFIHVPHPFELEDIDQFGNGIVLCGPHCIELHGYHVANCWRYTDDQETPVEFSRERSVRFLTTAEQGDIRPHMMLMHGSGDLRYFAMEGYGRTDRSRILDATNLNGRYPLHLHRAIEAWKSMIVGGYFTGSPGWGPVNHSSNTDFLDLVCDHIYGAGPVGEAGNEVGTIKHCLSNDIYSERYVESLTADGNRWHDGSGFAFSGPGIAIDDCCAMDCGIGFNWRANGMKESIAGGPLHNAKFANGQSPQQRNPEPMSNLRVYGYRRRAFKVVWFANEDGPPVSLSRLSAVNREQRGTAIEVSYNLVPVEFQDVRIDNCEYGLFFTDTGGSPYRFTDTHIRRARVGVRNKSAVDLRLRDSEISGDEMAIEANPSTQAGAGVSIVADDSQIDGPVRLVDPVSVGIDPALCRQPHTVTLNGKRQTADYEPWKE